MRQRALTDNQLKLILLENEGLSPDEIATRMRITKATFYAKRAAIKRGLLRAAYSNVPKITSKNLCKKIDENDLFGEMP